MCRVPHEDSSCLLSAKGVQGDSEIFEKYGPRSAELLWVRGRPLEPACGPSLSLDQRVFHLGVVLWVLYIRS